MEQVSGTAWNSLRVDIGRIDICRPESERLFQVDPRRMCSALCVCVCDIVPRSFDSWKCRLINDITRDRRELVFRDRLKDRAGILFVFGMRVLLFFCSVSLSGQTCVCRQRFWRNMRFANNNPSQREEPLIFPKGGRGRAARPIVVYVRYLIKTLQAAKRTCFHTKPCNSWRYNIRVL